MSNYRKVENLLKKYKMYKVYIENVEDMIKEYEESKTLSGIDYSETKTSETYKINTPTEDIAINNIENLKDNEYIAWQKRTADSMKIEIKKIDRALEALNETERQVVTLFYIEDNMWWQVAAEVMYSEDYCREIRRKAINKMAIGIYGTQ